MLDDDQDSPGTGRTRALAVRNIEPIRLDGVRGTTLTVFCRDSTSLGLICADDWLVPHGTPTTRADRSLLRPARTHRTTIAPSALVTLALLVAGCSPSALRTHSTIATVARATHFAHIASATTGYLRFGLATGTG